MEQVPQPRNANMHLPRHATGDLSLSIYLGIADRILFGADQSTDRERRRVESGKNETHVDGRVLKYAKDRAFDSVAPHEQRMVLELSHIVAAENAYKREDDRGTPQEFRLSRSYGISGMYGSRDAYLARARSLLEVLTPESDTKPI